MKRVVRIEEAVGMVLAHDITEIRKGEFKGRAFKKGYQIKQTDLCHLQRLGKHHIYVLDIKKGYLHENDAAVALANSFCGPAVGWEGGPKEGKLNLLALSEGLLKVDAEALFRINLLADVMCASLHHNSLVQKGNIVAATRAIPLTVKKTVVDEAVNIAQVCGGIFQINPLRKVNAGLVITGNEIFTHLVEDQFEAVLRKKLQHLGAKTIGVSFTPDDANFIEQEIARFLAQGADLILTTAGMSVDPDDLTRQGIKQAGATEFIYGAAVIPGAMFMLAYIDEVPVLGVPACGLYHQATVLDLVLPRVLAGERLTRRDIAQLGHGGLCLNCSKCRYPLCPFGKGGDPFC
jgi:hypothetical protein